MKEVIAINEKKECPFCKIDPSSTFGFKCPECGGEFCGYCFVSDHESDGRSGKCPYCKKPFSFSGQFWSKSY